MKTLLSKEELHDGVMRMADKISACYADRQLTIVEGVEAPPNRRTGHQRHASLNCARSASRARASRDFTVPTAIPSEKPISS